jgi:hypothetical protein
MRWQSALRKEPARIAQHVSLGLAALLERPLLFSELASDRDGPEVRDDFH